MTPIRFVLALVAFALMVAGSLASAAGVAAALQSPSHQSSSRCVSWLFATHADTTFYETHCVGGARPDSIANPEDRR